MKSFGGSPKAARLERMRASPLWSGEGFRNIHPVMPQLRDASVASPTLSDFLCGGDRRVPQPAVAGHRSAPDLGQGAGKRVARYVARPLDRADRDRRLPRAHRPGLGARASPSRLIGPKRFQPVPSRSRRCRAIDLVVISHDHYDHLDYPTIRALAGNGRCRS
jgi:hypothetical protein